MEQPLSQPAYWTTPEQLHETLQTHGVAVIPNLLTPGECQAMENGLWHYLATVTAKLPKPIRRDDPTTYATYAQLSPLHSMLLHHWGIGQAQVLWDLRQNPRLVDVFAKLWQSAPEDLLVSFDGASFHFPPEVTGTGWYAADWYHVDQSYLRTGLQCVQSWVTAREVRPGDATLSVLQGSHRYQAEFARTFPADLSREDWFKLEERHLAFYRERQCRPLDLTCPAGSLVLWDSRTVHMGKEAQRTRAEPNFRCVAYLCYTPRSWATPEVLRCKQQMVQELRTANHYPHRPRVFPQFPQTWGQPLPDIAPIPAPVLTPLGRRLAGY
jgi:hypothetical protein